MPVSPEIQIHAITDLAAMDAVQQLEIEVWQMEHPVPTHQLLTSVKNGGMLLGAYDGSLLVGILYSFPGYLNGEAYLCSHMMGIKEGWRSKGIGERLKQEQAAQAVTLGYRMITWTYDPLETANGYLNISKLGAICSTYINNCYGEMNDLLNQGLPSDRFQVEWWVDRPRPVLPEALAVRAFSWKINDRGLPQPEVTVMPATDTAVIAVPVPASIQKVKQSDIGLAKEWRRATGQVFSQAFASGWAATGLRLNSEQPVYEYLLVKRAQLALPIPPWKGEDCE